MTKLTTSEIQNLVENLFPEASSEEKLRLDELVPAILEGKDVGKFKGDISVYKQRALDTVNSMPKALSLRRKDEKSASKELDKLVDSLEAEMMKLVRRYREPDGGERKISITQFKSGMKSALRAAYKSAYELGTSASGLGREAPDLTTHMGADEKKFLDNLFTQEQKYFNKFLDDLANGQSVSKAEVRCRDYANAVRSVFEAARTVHLPDNTLIYWVLQSSNPCIECRLLHRHSPYTKDTLPTTPKSGSTRCLARCGCQLRTVKASAAEVARVARKNKSAANVLRQLKQSRKKH